MAKEDASQSPRPCVAERGEGESSTGSLARADFVLLGHIVVSSCRPLGNLCWLSFPLLTSASMVVKLGPERGERGGKLVKVTFHFLFLGDLIDGIWSLASYNPVFWFPW